MNSFAASSQDTKKYDGRVKGQEGLCACHGLHVDHVVHGTYLCGIFAFAQVTLENYISTYILIYIHYIMQSSIWT